MGVFHNWSVVSTTTAFHLTTFHLTLGRLILDSGHLKLKLQLQSAVETALHLIQELWCYFKAMRLLAFINFS